MIVVDVGCATYGGDTSIPYLVEEFEPTTLFGFDPAVDDDHYLEGSTMVVVKRAAAWTYDGEINFTVRGLGGKVDPAGSPVPCVDLARFIVDLGEPDVVLKMDAEGAEYELLPLLHERGVDRMLRLCWVEWHCLKCERGGGHRPGCASTRMEADRERIEAMMGCEMHRWNR